MTGNTYEATLQPGDILFIPDFTWHFLWPTELTMSAHVYGNAIQLEAKDPFTWKDYILHLRRWHGWKYPAALAGQFLWNGVLRRPYSVETGFQPHPAGVVMWYMVRGKMDELEDLP